MTSISLELNQPSASPETGEERVHEVWRNFNIEYPSEQACLDKLLSISTDDDFSCPDCGEVLQTKREENGRLLICICRKKTWLLANTVFHGVRRPRAWLAALYFLSHRIIISASAFARLLEISPTTAGNIFKKIGIAVNNKMSFLPELSSAVFIEVVNKRSRETPARQHPVTEQDEMEKNVPGPEEEQADPFAETAYEESREELAFQKSIFENLIDGQNFDAIHDQMEKSFGEISTGRVLGSLVMLELKGLIVQEFCIYRRALKKKKLDLHPENKAKVIPFLEFIRETFQGISRKYLQLYMATYWCITDTESWEPEKIFEVFKSASRVTYKRILSFVTPHSVKFPIAA